MTIANPDDQTLEKIFKEKKRIAVVGLSDNPARVSYNVSKVMQDAGYEIIPVNPMIDESLGVPAVSSLKDIDGHVDIVNVFRQSHFLPEIAKGAVEIGADVLWTQLDVVNEEARKYAQNNGLIVVMDRCIKVEYERLH